jgi:hypothetical protein
MVPMIEQQRYFPPTYPVAGCAIFGAKDYKATIQRDDRGDARGAPSPS